MKLIFLILLSFAHINSWAGDLDRLSINEIPLGSKIQFVKPTVIPSNTSEIHFAGCILTFVASPNLRQFTSDHSLVIKKVDGRFQNERVGADCQLMADGSRRCEYYETRKVALTEFTFKVQKNSVDTGANNVTMLCRDESGIAFMSIGGLKQDLESEGAKLVIESEIADF